jgi:hypothetical protein
MSACGVVAAQGSNSRIDKITRVDRLGKEIDRLNCQKPQNICEMFDLRLVGWPAIISKCRLGYRDSEVQRAGDPCYRRWRGDRRD